VPYIRRSQSANIGSATAQRPGPVRHQADLISQFLFYDRTQTGISRGLSAWGKPSATCSGLRTVVIANDRITAGTGNAFEDLGLPDADARLAKAELARLIGAIVHERGLTQHATASILGVGQPKVSALLAVS
jgi:predicted XRE-type DNA-binding protein